MHRTALPLLSIMLAAWLSTVWAADGSMTYRARLVHENRSTLTFVHGAVDLRSGNFVEHIDRSYELNWRELPGALAPTHATLPTIWRAEGRTAQRFGTAMPRYDSPLLRHFIVGEIIASDDQLSVGDSFLAGQLVLNLVSFGASSFEIVAEFRGLPLVIVGRRTVAGNRHIMQDLAVLGPASELYQYFFEEVKFSPEPLAQPPSLPQVDWGAYVSFPDEGARPVAVRPIKDWLVFQAQLPNRRPLNLVFDSGADTMILDELVLKVDALLEPAGRIQVGGALATGEMNLYEGFSFEVGGVQFHDLQVAGTQLTSLAIGSDVRIHGIVGSDILRLCRLDLDLEEGLLALSPRDAAAVRSGEELQLTFIGDLPHVEARVHNGDNALLLLDTGQRSALSVNLDWLDSYELGDRLMMNGFLGDITGGLRPRYIVEELDVSLAGQTYREKTVDAALDSTYHYDGVPVIGSIGFPLIARHFGGVTFDYYNRLVYLRKPAERRMFAGRPEAWEIPSAEQPALPSAAGSGREAPPPPAEVTPEEYADYEYAVAAVTCVARDPRRPELVLDRDPESDDPRSGYAWAGHSGSLADPLTLIRTAEPGWSSVGDGSFIGWSAENDPRHKPVILPDRSDYNAQIRDAGTDPDLQTIPIDAKSAESAEQGFPAVAISAAAEGFQTAAALDQSPAARVPATGDGLLRPSSISDPELHEALAELAQSVWAEVSAHAGQVRELLVRNAQTADAQAEGGNEAIYESGLGSSRKRSDYPFPGNAPRLKFRPR